MPWVYSRTLSSSLVSVPREGEELVDPPRLARKMQVSVSCTPIDAVFHDGGAGVHRYARHVVPKHITRGCIQGKHGRRGRRASHGRPVHDTVGHGHGANVDGTIRIDR